MIHLKNRQPAFLKQLAFPGLSIVCRTGTPKDHTIRLTNEMIGTGPFVPTSMQATTVLTASGRTDYWGGAVKLNTLRIEAVQDATVALNRFRTGELDLMQIVPADIEKVRSDPKLSACLRLTPKAGVVYLQMNSHSFPALADRRVRQALAMSIDRARLERDVLHDSQKRATRFTPVGNGPVEVLPYDRQAAARLMAIAGYPEGRGFPKLQLEYAANGRQNPGAEAIVTDWRSNLGIDATIWAGASGALLQKNQEGNLPLYFTGWTADYSDLGDFLPQIARTSAPENHSGMSVPGLDKILDQISNTPDSPERDRLVDAAEKLVMADAHVIPLYFVTDPELVSPRFTGVEIAPFGNISLTEVAPMPVKGRNGG